MEPASIRYKNPGAMWGSALAIKWGAAKQAVTLNDGKGQGNNIAVFPTFVAGICAQLDLWRTSKNYRNKKFSDAIRVGKQVRSRLVIFNQADKFAHSGVRQTDQHDASLHLFLGRHRHMGHQRDLAGEVRQCRIGIGLDIPLASGFGLQTYNIIHFGAAPTGRQMGK